MNSFLVPLHPVRDIDPDKLLRLSYAMIRECHREFIQWRDKLKGTLGH